MKQSIKLLLGGALLLSLPMFLTSCEDILGEWSKPAPVNVTPDDGGSEATSNQYYAWDGTQLKAEDIPTTGIQEVTTATNEFAGGFYIVKEDVTIPIGVKITADSKLILCDGTTLTINGYLEDQSGTTTFNLSIYGQENSTGKLIVTSSDANGIWANNIEIHGGDISATATTTSDMMAPNGLVSASNLSIFGGKVVANGGAAIYNTSWSASIPGGKGIDCGGDLIIKGSAVVKAYGGADFDDGVNLSSGGEGINVANDINISGSADIYALAGKDAAAAISSSGDIIVSGGKVEAVGDNNGNGMEATTPGKALIVSGGTVTATGGTAGYGFDGTINLSGGLHLWDGATSANTDQGTGDGLTSTQRYVEIK